MAMFSDKRIALLSYQSTWNVAKWDLHQQKISHKFQNVSLSFWILSYNDMQQCHRYSDVHYIWPFWALRLFLSPLQTLNTTSWSRLMSPVFPTADGFPAPIWRWQRGRRWRSGRTSVALCPSKLPSPDASPPLLGQFIHFSYSRASLLCLFAHLHVGSLFSALSRVIISLTERH